MSAIYRGFRNVYRNKVRTIIVIIILSMSIAVFLTMVIVDDGVNDGIDDVENSVDTSIELRPAGSYGGFSMGGFRPGGGPGGGSRNQSMEPSYISESVNSYVRSIPHVESTSRTLSYMATDVFTLIMGLEPDAALKGMDGSLVVLLEGNDLTLYDSDSRVVVVSTNYSEENSIEIGDSITLNETNLEVVGMFSSETRFGLRTMFVPIDTVQSIFDLEDQLSQITVTVDSPKNVDLVYEEMRVLLNTDELDIIHPGEESEEVIDSLETISQNSEIGALVALAVGSTIVFFIMVLVTRERRREIGTLKALGASDGDVLKQFMAETMTIAILGATIGLIVAVVGGSVIADTMVGDEANEEQGGGAPNWLNPEQADRFRQRQSQQSNQEEDTDTEDVMSSISYSLTPSIVTYAFAAAIVIGSLGILYPALKASRMRPVEALRYE